MFQGSAYQQAHKQVNPQAFSRCSCFLPSFLLHCSRSFLRPPFFCRKNFRLFYGAWSVLLWAPISFAQSWFLPVFGGPLRLPSQTQLDLLLSGIPLWLLELFCWALCCPASWVYFSPCCPFCRSFLLVKEKYFLHKNAVSLGTVFYRLIGNVHVGWTIRRRQKNAARKNLLQRQAGKKH